MPYENRPCLPLYQDHANLLIYYLKSGCIEVSLHGFSHQKTNFVTQSTSNTEFQMLDPKEQADRISRGQAYLERMLAIRPDIFVPPYNSYDLNTVACLEEAGFSILSGSKQGPFPCTSLTFVPETSPITDVREAVRRPRNSQEIEPFVVALLHEYELNTDKGDPRRAVISIGEIEALLDWLVAQPDVQATTLKGIARETHALDTFNLVQESKKFTGIMKRYWPVYVFGKYPMPEYGYFPSWRDERTNEWPLVSVWFVILVGYCLATAAFLALVSSRTVRLVIKNQLSYHTSTVILLVRTASRYICLSIDMHLGINMCCGFLFCGAQRWA